VPVAAAGGRATAPSGTSQDAGMTPRRAADNGSQMRAAAAAAAAWMRHPVMVGLVATEQKTVMHDNEMTGKQRRKGQAGPSIKPRSLTGQSD